jgi:hypothetical protein
MPYISGGSPTAFDLNMARFSSLVSMKSILICFGTD